MVTGNTFKDLFDRSSDLICTINDIGDLEWCNSAFSDFWGISSEKLTKASFVAYTNLIGNLEPKDILSKIQHSDLGYISISYIHKIKKEEVVLNWHVTWKKEEHLFYFLANTTNFQKNAFEKPELNSKNQYLLNFSPIPILIYDISTFKILDVNQMACTCYGYSKTEFLSFTYKALLREKDLAKFKNTHEKIKKSEDSIWLEPCPHLKRDGSLVHMHSSLQKIWYQNQWCVLVSSQDVTEQQRTRAIEILERDFMEHSVNHDRPLKDMLHDFLKGLENIFPHMKASVLKVENNHIYNVASPSLPTAFVNAINGEKIGPIAGSCGTAAFIKKTVIVADISSDPLWEYYKVLALPNNLKACWSLPIFNAKKEVIATFANYYETIKKPSDEELKLFERSASLLSIILQNHQKTKEISSSNERFTYVNMATNDAIFDWNIQEDHIYWGGSFTRLFGHRCNEGPYPISEKVKLIHSSDKTKFKKGLKEFLNNKKQQRWEIQYGFKKADETYCHIEEKGFIIRNEKGRGVRLIGILSDVTNREAEITKNKIRASLYQIFAKTDSIKKSLIEATKLLSQYGNFSTTEIWLVNLDKNKLYLAAKHGNDEHGKRFLKETSSLKELEYAEGLPGKIWESGQPEILTGSEEDGNFIRKKAAQKSELREMIGLPLIEDKGIIGAVIIGSPKRGINFLDLEQNFGDLANLLGTEIKRKQIETELKQLFETAPDIICQMDFKGRFKRINTVGCELLEYDEKELINRSQKKLVHPDDLALMQKCLGRLQMETKTLNSQNRYITRSGKTIWLSWNCRPSHEEGLIYAVGKNITEEKALTNLLDSATEMARIGSWEVDLIRNTVYWSKITKEIHEVDQNFRPDLTKGINFYRKDFQPIVQGYVEKSIADGISWDVELAIITAKGNEIWVRSIGRPEFKEGKCIRIYGSFQDINKRKTVELRLKAISNNLPGVIFQYHLFPDGTDKLNFVSRGALDLWELSPEQCEADSGLIWQQIGAGGDMALVKQSILDSAKNLSIWHCQWRNRNANNQVHWHEGTARPKLLKDGTVVWDSFIQDITAKKELQKGFEKATKMARIGNWEMDLTRDNKILWSKMTREILEVDDDFTPTLKKTLSFYHNKDKSKLKAAIDNLINTGEKFDLELLATTYAKENDKWIRIIGELESVQGKSVKIYGSIQDIHHLKKVEVELIKTLAEKNEILDRIGDAFFAVDKRWIVYYWNKEAEKILQTPKEKILGKNLWDVFSDAKENVSYKYYHRAIRTGKTIHFQDFYALLERWFEISAYPSRTGLSVYFKDITERKQAEEQLRISNERFEKVSEATNDAVWEWDVNNTTLYWGKGFKTLFGYDVAKVNPTLKSWSEHLHPEDKQTIMDSLHSILENPLENHWSVEYRYMKKDGNYRNVWDKGVVIRDNKGQPVRMVGAMSDITERKNYEKSLKEVNLKLKRHARELAISNEELEQFAYMASHDLQEPLRMVTGFLTQLEKKYSDKLDDKAHQYIDLAVDGAKRMRRIILDLLEFSRIGKEEHDLELVDLNEVVDQVLVTQQQQISDGHIEVQREKLPQIYGYKTPLTQVFHNLISNAIKFGRKEVGSVIAVLCIEKPNFWEFEIKDNGIGIDEEYLSKIFLIFQRLHSSDEFAGTGIGLSIVKKIIERLGGTIWVTSQLGKGSSFYFTLPKQK